MCPGAAPPAIAAETPAGRVQRSTCQRPPPRRDSHFPQPGQAAVWIWTSSPLAGVRGGDAGSTCVIGVPHAGHRSRSLTDVPPSRISRLGRGASALIGAVSAVAGDRIARCLRLAQRLPSVLPAVGRSLSGVHPTLPGALCVVEPLLGLRG